MNTKIRCSILSVVLMLFALGTVQLTAQGSCPPTPDCHGDPWIGPVSTTFTMYGPLGEECEMEVTFCYRFACSTYFDMYITSVSIPPECFGVFTTQQILDQAMNAVWENNPWQTNIPTCPNGQPVWRVFSAGCYASVPPGGCNQVDPPVTIAMTLSPCHETAQCFALYKICKTQSGKIQETLINTSPAGECTGMSGDCPCSHWCPGE